MANIQQFVTLFEGDYFFLSNFYPVEIEYKGIKYPTVEHAFQLNKCISKFDADKIADIKCPRQLRILADTVLMRTDWHYIRAGVMRELLNLKFEKYELRKKLFDTWPSILIDGNIRHEIYWGKCYCGGHMFMARNVMGELLMEIRDSIRPEEVLPTIS